MSDERTLDGRPVPTADHRPRFRAQLTHPSSNDEDKNGRRAILRVEETISSLTVVELELTSADLHDLLSQRWTYPGALRFGRDSDRWGREMRVTQASYASEESAQDARRALESRGWVVDAIRRDNRQRYIVIGRRWDDDDTEKEG